MQGSIIVDTQFVSNRQFDFSGLVNIVNVGSTVTQSTYTITRLCDFTT